MSLASDKNAQMASSVSAGLTATSSLNCCAASSYRSAWALQNTCHQVGLGSLTSCACQRANFLYPDAKFCTHDAATVFNKGTNDMDHLRCTITMKEHAVHLYRRGSGLAATDMA